MPEGNTVWLTARRLRGLLANRVVTVAELRTAELATVDLVGTTVLEVVPRGKHLLIRFDDGRTLHSHLRMDGSWRVRPAVTSAAAIRDRDDHVRAVLGNESGTAVGDRVHDIALIPTSAENTLVGHLGPDLLGPDWDAAEVARRLRSNPTTSIAEALLDQRNLAGAGNVYKCETCFLAGLSPWTAVGDVPDLDAVVDLVYRLLRANRERYDHVTTGNARAGQRTWVYDRGGRPCRRCGTTIRSGWQGEPPRLSYWCPRCQPEIGGQAEVSGRRSTLVRRATRR